MGRCSDDDRMTLSWRLEGNTVALALRLGAPGWAVA